MPLIVPLGGPPLAGVRNVLVPPPELLLELELLLEPEELPELEELLLEPDELLELELLDPDELPELELLLGVHPAAEPAGIISPLSMTM